MSMSGFYNLHNLHGLINFINLKRKLYIPIVHIPFMARGRSCEDYTTIGLSKSTRDALKEIAKKSETYDDLIRRLMVEAGYSEVLIKNKEADRQVRGWLDDGR